jgi:ribosomal protein S18 acetylase RimI-like enzyme
MIRIRVVQPKDLEKILPLVEAYQRFYLVEPDGERNRVFFHRLAESPEQGIQFGAFTEDGEFAVGFATLYFPPSSLSAKHYCLLNDLFTLPEYRGKGVARLLVTQCLSFAKKRGFSEVEWLTRDSNETAQKFYDRLGAQKTSWFYYTLPVT